MTTSDPLVRIPLEVAHFAMPVFGEPDFEFSGVIRWKRAGEPAVVETRFTRALTDGFFHRCAAWAR